MALPKWFVRKFVEGFFILLPVLIAYLMLGQLFDGLLALTQPAIDLMPPQISGSELAHRLTAAAALLVIFLAIGIVSTTRPARAFGDWVERSVLNRFPPYTVLRSLVDRLGGKDVPAQLQPALLTLGPGMRTLVAIVEELPDDELTVFVPIAPTPGIGVLQIVSASKVERLETSMSNALGWILNWGVGTEALLGGRSKNEPGETAS
jgi:uncharacterized membrane protein